jgi:hypothetical protein
MEFAEFVDRIRNAASREEERDLIADSLANMRTRIRDCSSDERPEIVAKLVFLNISGERVSWGAMEAVALVSSERLSHKRLGYLAVSQFLDADDELLVLLTQTLTNDLTNSSAYIQSHALTFLANHGSAEMYQTLYPAVEKLTESPHPGIMKRAGMVAIRIIHRHPDLAPTFRKALTRLMGSQKHAVVATGVLLAVEFVRSEPDGRRMWANLAKPLTKLLKVLSLSRPSNEFQMSIFNDPFLQIKAMQLLGLLGCPSEDLDDALTGIVTAVDVQRNTGRSLLFQAVETIGLVAKKQSLYGLALNQIGRLFTFRDPNVLYSALSVFSRILYNGHEIIDRSSKDSIALQRYKSQIVHCLDHPDSSIRRRALDVVLALVDASNAESLIPELIEYLHLADRDFRTEMASKIYSAVQRFAPSLMWNFDIVHLLLIDSGNYVGNDIISSFCKLIASHRTIREHALPLLVNTMYGYSSNQALVQVAAWVIGQFQVAFDAEIVETMAKIVRMPQTTVETKCYLITSLGKLAARGSQVALVAPVFDELGAESNVELQQRAGEMKRILERQALWDSLLEAGEYETVDEEAPRAQIVAAAGGGSEVADILDLDAVDAGPALIDLGSIPAKPNPLLELNATPSPGQAQQQTAPAEAKTPTNAREALRTSDFVIYFEIQKNAANPRQIAIRATIFNLTPHSLTNFDVHYGVPIGWALKLQSPGGAELPAHGGGLRQILMLENRGNAPLMMKAHTTYMFGCQPLTDDSAINPIFD